MRTVIRSLSLVTAVVALLAAGAAAAWGARSTDPPVVRIAAGRVQGDTDGDHLVFQGIPYAAPPVGPLRFRAPQPVQPWSGVRDATHAASGCAQTYAYNGPPTFDGSEDCLYLNVWVPQTTSRSPKPVLVFFHGGGFTGGNGSFYDPRRVTRQGDVIVVTVNYRLGALGFLSHPALTDPWAGNFGIADQQAALRWTRQNIRAFGGDARNVTMWGESAGAYSVCANLASPSARGLFDKAITQSGPCGNDFLTPRVAEHRGVTAATDLGCTGPTVVDCLRAVPAVRLSELGYDAKLTVRRIADLPWLPVAGTAPFPRQPLDAIQRGHHVPLLLATTRDEMRTLIIERFRAGHGLVTAAQYSQLVRDFYGPDAGRVLAAYPLERYESPSVALATLLTDEGRAAGACRQLAYAAAAPDPVYVAEFAEPTGAPPYDGFVEGAAHGADVPYFLDAVWVSEPMPEPQARLAETLIDHWTRFARTGDAGWPAYRRGHGTQFSTAYIGDVNLAREHNCTFWNTIR